LGLLARGIKKGDKIASISNNRPEWNFIDMGMAMIGVVHVPLYTSLSCPEYENILRHSDARFVFVSDSKLLVNLKPAIVKVENIENTYTFDLIDGEKNWLELTELGQKSDCNKYFVPDQKWHPGSYQWGRNQRAITRQPLSKQNPGSSQMILLP